MLVFEKNIYIYIKAHLIMLVSSITGVQTIGGVFVRQMKITSRASASVTEMYSAASSQLTKTNATASKATFEDGGRAGILGIGKRYDIYLLYT